MWVARVVMTLVMVVFVVMSGMVGSAVMVWLVVPLVVGVLIQVVGRWQVGWCGWSSLCC